MTAGTCFAYVFSVICDQQLSVLNWVFAEYQAGHLQLVDSLQIIFHQTPQQLVSSCQVLITLQQWCRSASDMGRHRHIHPLLPFSPVLSSLIP